MEPTYIEVRGALRQVAAFRDRLQEGSRFGYEDQQGQWHPGERVPGALSPQDIGEPDVLILATLVTMGHVQWDAESWCWLATADASPPMATDPDTGEV